MTPTVAIIGLGYVGLPLAEALATQKKYRVIGIDIDAKKIAGLKKSHRHRRIEFSNEFSLLKEADIAIVCVPTPIFKNHHPDYRPLQNAVASIARCPKKGRLIIIESTINPGTCEEIVLPILERFGLKSEKDFFLAHCPERIDPGNAKWNLLNIPRIVGGLSKTSCQKAARFYRSFVKAPVKEMKSIKAAEATKIVENSFRDINIAYVNELAMSFDELGIDIVDVLEGAATKPFAFMAHYPGCGVGGHCIPVDPCYLIERARKEGFKHDFLEMARRVNRNMPAYAVKLLEDQMEKMRLSKKKTTVGLLGLAYKPNIADMRESPALEILNILKRKKYDVVTYDPYIQHPLNTADMGTLLQRADVLLLATAHREFLKITANVLKRYNIVAVIDGRNVLPKDAILSAGIVYKGIGR